MKWPMIITIAVLVLFTLGAYLRSVWQRAQRVDDAPEIRMPKFDSRIDPVCMRCGKPLSDSYHDARLGLVDFNGNELTGCAGYFED